MSPLKNHFQVIVVGAGVNGLSAAYHLTRFGCTNVAVVDRFPLRHPRGSSHGATRITRSTYHAADYSRLMQHIFAEEMPRWERDLGGPLSIPTPGCFFGPEDGAYPKYRESVAGFGDLVTEVQVDDARRRFPQLTFDDAKSVLVDQTCAVLLAETIQQRLIEFLHKSAVKMRENCCIRSIENAGSQIELKTNAESLFADQLIVTAGGWVGELIPAVARSFTVVRQTVGYFPASGDARQYRPGRFPVWVYVGRNGDDYYGLPQLDSEGVKFAKHVRSGVADDPDHPPETPDEAQVDRLNEFGRRHFDEPLGTPRVDHCLYTNTADEDFIIDRHPADPRIQIGSACSGHGFKFAPLTGRILAERVILGRSLIDHDAAIVRRFSLQKQ